MAIMTVTEVENGKIKSISITADETDIANMDEAPKDAQEGTFFVPFDELAEFNKECNKAILNNKKVKKFLKGLE